MLVFKRFLLFVHGMSVCLFVCPPLRLYIIICKTTQFVQAQNFINYFLLLAALLKACLVFQVAR